MKKIISFCLWGNNPTYNVGAIQNAILAKDIYPEFECWFYIHEDSVPTETVNQLKLLSNTKIFFKQGDVINENCKPRLWRYESIDDDDVEIMMPRDTDTRILLRERIAVEEWLKCDTVFHIMRDHPHHNFCILGGMFGTKKLKEIPSWKNSMDLYLKKDNRMYDQDYLKEFIYPIIKNNSTIHASFHNDEFHSKKFPINYDSEFRFVGEYVYFDETRSIEHINILKERL